MEAFEGQYETAEVERTEPAELDCNNLKEWSSGEGRQGQSSNRQALLREEMPLVVNGLGKGQPRAVQVRISRAELIKTSILGLVISKRCRNLLDTKEQGILEYYG